MRALSTRGTQCGRILRVLVDARGEWVDLPTILALKISQYGSRIYSLRRQGFHIENHSAMVNGVRRTAFRLVVSPNEAEETTECDTQPIPAACSGSHNIGATLFGDISPDRTYEQ